MVVRSTVPVGTSREVVLPPLLEAWGSAGLVMAPERTIQGQALRELVELPQVVGGLDDESLELGLTLFGGLARRVVPVSNLGDGGVGQADQQLPYRRDLCVR